MYRTFEDVVARVAAVPRGYAVLGVTTFGLAAILHKLYTKRRAVRKLQKQGIPILPHSWLTGHLPILFEFYKDHPSDVNSIELEAWLIGNRKRFFPEATDPKDLPPVLYLDLWPVAADPLAFICDARLATQFLAPLPGVAGGVDRGPVMKVVLKPLTGGSDLASAEGEEWKMWRTRINPGFSSRNLTALVPEMIDEILVFAEGLEQMADSKGRSSDVDDGWGPVFQLWHRTSSLTADVIARALVDRRLHDQTTNRAGGAAVKAAMLDTMRIGKEQMTWSGWLSNLVSAGRKNASLLAKHHKDMDDFLDPAINSALGLSTRLPGTAPDDENNNTSGGGGGSGKTTIIQLLCSGTIPVDDNAFKFIQGTLKVMMFAGFDSTATAICWMFKELQDHPDSLAKLRAEHDRLFGAQEKEEDGHADNDTNQPPDCSTAATAKVLRKSPHLLNNLPYTAAVIKETLRLHMPIPVARQNHAASPTAHFQLVVDPASGQAYPTCGYAMFDGSAWIQRAPEYWGPRAGEFLPERWLVSVDDVGHPLHPTYSGPASDLYRPFALGPRQCIGRELAYTEMKLVAALVVRKFDLREAWEEWDKSRDHLDDKPKSTVRGQRLYATGQGAAQVKDDMPVQVRLARRTR
ncbi:cytochrome P450 [Microdochium trichocladiopsis]|uniref:Cytochrome P450 n=1 Tax=Microdochium trichocladiopsis TaxID=1682393 RepID=A0A9P8XXX5_9PEZI|nr:cytochrome P450 [Microdochium trichocladiopsis]KAH7018522.1 cytochrome P450 [Microdochium trichocladiopsis]